MSIQAGTTDSGGSRVSKPSSQLNANRVGEDVGGFGCGSGFPPVAGEEEVEVVDLERRSAGSGGEGLSSEDVADSRSNLGPVRLPSSFRCGRS